MSRSLIQIIYMRDIGPSVRSVRMRRRGEVQRKDTREESPKVQNPRGWVPDGWGCGTARATPEAPLCPRGARALGLLSHFLTPRYPISQRS